MRDTISICNGDVLINGEKIEEPYLSFDTETPVWENGFMENCQEVTIPSEHYFVMGDNRLKASDSRKWGFLPKQNMQGQYMFCYFNCSD